MNVYAFKNIIWKEMLYIDSESMEFTFNDFPSPYEPSSK